MAMIVKIVKVVLGMVSWLIRTVIGAVGLAVIAVACVIGPPEAPPRIETVLLPAELQQNSFQRDLVGVSLLHASWDVRRHLLISLAEGRLPTGQDVRAIGCCGRWLLLARGPKTVAVRPDDRAE